MMKDRFYLACLRDNVGSNTAFHAINGCGYVTDLSKAHVYTQNEMQERVNKGHYREFELPLSADHVDELAVLHIDCQYLDTSKGYPDLISESDSYIAVKKGVWDGNDLAMACTLEDSFNYEQAAILSSCDFQPNNALYVFIPKEITDKVTRKTFAHRLINRRKMISGAGIIGVKKQRESKSTGKTRHNCPSCGKIHWQYDPYSFDGCNDINCFSSKYNKGLY